jgi:hypothetical protein
MVMWYAIGILTILFFINTVAAVSAWVELRAMKNATHSIQMVPATSDAAFQKITDELRQELTDTEYGAG